MPSLTYTPGALALAGGEINPEPIRFGFTAGALRLTGGVFEIGTTLSSSVTGSLEAVLDNLFSSEAIVDAHGRPTRRLQQIWKNAIGGLKRVLTSQGASIDELEALYAALTATQAIAVSAVQTAQATAQAIDLTTSYTDPVGVLTAASSGTVTIDAHERVYGDGARVSVAGGTVSGFAPGDAVTIYYNDPARAGGAVSFSGTTSAVAQSGDVHIVGQVTVPEVGQPDEVGAGPTAPGFRAPASEDYDYSALAYFVA